jgi:hypothetical protein
MKKVFRVAVCVLVVTLNLGRAAWADLSHPLYEKAKLYYIDEDYAQTVKFLNRYKKADRQFLKDNPDVLTKINEVIAYSKRLSSSSLSLKGVDAPPFLPEPGQN